MTKRVEVPPQVRNRRGKGERNHQKYLYPSSRRRRYMRQNCGGGDLSSILQDIDLTIMTNDKKFLAQHREELEIKIKDIFIWALVEDAATEMTKTVRDNDPNKMSINQLYVCLGFISYRSETYFVAEPIFSASHRNRTKEQRTYGRETANREKLQI